MAIGWIEDGHAHLLDGHAIGQSEPVIDRHQDWTLLHAQETHTLTILKLRRPISSSDPEDLCISDDTVRLIWAFHSEDPKVDDTRGK